MNSGRDVVMAPAPVLAVAPAGRNVVVAIGIDRYRDRRWSGLRNAVSDAVGAAQAFKQLGFEEIVSPLLDELATGDAIDQLVTDELDRELRPEDSLVVFYAGHGGVRSQTVGVHEVNTGHLIPVDADQTYASWIELKPWLDKIARLPPQHILVILDACKAGIALSDAIPRTRDSDTAITRPFAAASRKRSRLLITSAGEGELALDDGPRLGHSLFTSCLLDALTGGEVPSFLHDGRPMTIGSNLGHHVRTLVQLHAGEPGQTPVVGRFRHDEHGEMLIPSPASEHAVASRRFAQGSNQLPVSSGGDEPSAVATRTRWSRRSAVAVAALVALVALVAFAALAVPVLVAWRRRAVDVSPRDRARAVRGEPAERLVSLLADVEPDVGVPLEGSADAAVDAGRAAAVVDADRAAALGAVRGEHHDGATSNGPMTPPVAAGTASTQVRAPAARAARPAALCSVRYGSPQGATVEWNHEIKALPASLSLPCGGVAELMFRQAHRVDAPRKVTAQPGEMKDRVVRMIKITVNVAVRSTPRGAQISIGNRVVGRTPATLKLPEAEAVTLSFSKSGCAPLERRITPTVDSAVDVELTRLGR